MQIFFDQKLVFLAVPKAGSTSCEAAFRRFASVDVISPPGRRHMTSRRFQRTLRAKLEREHKSRFETFAVLRDPLDRIASWFRYRKRQGSNKSTAGLTFDEFVRLTLHDCPPPAAKIGSQDCFVKSEFGDILVDHLFCIENPAPFIAFATDRFQFPIILEHLNKSPAIDMTLSEEIKSLFANAKNFKIPSFSYSCVLSIN